MLVSYKWLQRYVDINVDPQTLADQLTMAGITVDLVHWPWQNISSIFAGKIKEITKHPDADKLVVCQIEMGGYKENLGENGLLQIVTGAPNVKEGQTVPVAVHGAGVVGGKINKSKLRGVPATGMLCSKGELNVESTPHEEDGIWILPDTIEPGTDLIKELLLDDAVLELDLTPNRSDCLSIINVAREVSAILGTDLHLPEISYPETSEKIEDIASIQVIDKDLCPRYTGRVIKNVQTGESPLWMQHFLQTAGIRPISNVVDVSNFVMLEWGQPLHTFDYDTLDNHEIIVRKATEGEEITTLDQQERKLAKDTLLICDTHRPICIAGVMGGLNTEITADTKNILLEAAAFDRVSIRRTSKALGLRSEASMRYEKGVDATNLDVVSRRAIQLLVDLCGGEAVSGIIDTMETAPEPAVVPLRPKRVNQHLGTDFTEEQMVDCMKRLKFDIKKVCDNPAEYQIVAPFYRPDITLEVDLIEEVARLLGYDNVPTNLPYGAMTEGKKTPEQAFGDAIINEMVGLGANQIVTYSFLSPREWDRLHLPPDHVLRNNIEIMNPLNEDQKAMRTTLLPNMLKVAAKNHSRRNNDLLLFEKGSVFLPCGEDLPKERAYLAIVATGKDESNWLGQGAERDFFYVKGMWEALCSRFHIEKWNMQATKAMPYLHPGRSAEIYVDGEYLGFLGELHPTIIDEYDLNGRAVVLQIDLDRLFPHLKAVPEYQSLPKFPASIRDIAITADRTIPVAAIEDVIKKAGGRHLTKISLFDVYEGMQIGKDNRSLAYNLTFQCADRTLTVEEVNESFDRIVSELENKFDAKLR